MICAPAFSLIADEVAECDNQDRAGDNLEHVPGPSRMLPESECFFCSADSTKIGLLGLLPSAVRIAGNWAVVP
jgi:hypothetical protein